jgi:hypothetical protein
VLKKTTLPLKILYIEDDGCHLLIKAKINRKAASILVDTGASKTVFDKSRIERFVNEKEFRKMEHLSTGLGVSDMQTHAVLINRLQLGTLIINDFETILLDLSHVNFSYDKLNLPAIDGVLGNDLLMQYKAIVDYKTKKLKLVWKKVNSEK